jgi:glyoxylase-like metal-dependent hydrolase (beta-lactamase superfamily II)
MKTPFKLTHLLLVMGLALWSPNSYTADFDFPVTRITEDIHLIYGSLDTPNPENKGFRNNPIMVTTSKGLVVFDPGGSAATGKLVVKKSKELGKGPIVAVFISHAHGDHWLGNEAIQDAYPNAVFYGHKNAQDELTGVEGQRWVDMVNKLTNNTAQGKRTVALNKTIDDGDVITIGDKQFRIHYTGPAHTDSDIMIEIVDENILFIGDIARNAALGIMDGKASFKGNIVAIDTILKKDYKLYIPAHGKAGGKEMLAKYRGYLSTVYDNVKKLFDSGMAGYEMKPKIMAKMGPYKNWAGFDIRSGKHISQAYLEIENEGF